MLCQKTFQRVMPLIRAHVLLMKVEVEALKMKHPGMMKAEEKLRKCVTDLNTMTQQCEFVN